MLASGPGDRWGGGVPRGGQGHPEGGGSQGRLINIPALTRQLGPILAAHPRDPKEKVPGCGLLPTLIGWESEEGALEISEKAGIKEGEM